MDRKVRIYNGMPARELGSEGWCKPWSGGNGGSCVEAMKLHDGRIALRQSTDPDGPALIYTNHEIARFIQGAKAGEADFLLPAVLTAPRREHGMTIDKGFAADEIDTSRPHPARMYDYFLGGRDNYEVDRLAAEEVIRLTPDTRPSAQANRDFLHRAVRVVVGEGIRQILDLGTGIPTSPNTHEVARRIDPRVRVAYADNDPIVATHAAARLTNTEGTGFALADLREPQAILLHDQVRRLIDFDEPVAVVLGAVLHFVSDDEDPAGVVAGLGSALTPGSFLILSHATGDFHQHLHDSDAGEVYRKATASLSLRTRKEIEPLFGPFQLLEPGLVQVPLWRPDGTAPAHADNHRIAFYGGVGRKG